MTGFMGAWSSIYQLLDVQLSKYYEGLTWSDLELACFRWLLPRNGG